MADPSRALQLQAFFDKADEAACLRFFQGATEAQRREVAPPAIATYKLFRKSAQVGGKITPRHTETARIAVLSACTLSELKTLGWLAVPDSKSAFQILAARRPAWLAEYVEWLLGENSRRWPLVRTLVRRGLCPRPKHDNYVLGMIISLDAWSWEGMQVDGRRPSLIESLREDRELLDDVVWGLFRIEGQGDLTLAAHDKYLQFRSSASDFCWNLALKELSQAGELSRERLLDESLEALNRGFSQFRVAWFSQFHELLEPSVKERMKRQEKYVVLLASPIPPTVTFALDALDIIDKERPLAANPLIEALQPVLLAKHKGTAKRAVQWLGRLAARDATCRTEAASAACQALAHEAAEVQKAAIEVLEKHGDSSDSSLRKQVSSATASVAASLRKRLTGWLSGKAAAGKSSQPAVAAPSAKMRGASAGDMSDLEKQAAALPAKWTKLAGIPAMLAAAKKGQIEITALDFGPLDVPRLDPAAALAPVNDIDEWIDACAHFLEAPEEIDEGERVLEGLSRLCGRSPDDLASQLGPLKKRIDKLYRGYCGPFLGLSLRDDVCGCVRAWISGEVITAKQRKTEHGHMAWFFADKDRHVWIPTDAPALWAISQRSQELAGRAAQRQSRPLLSAATHRGGWVDPLAFAERFLAWHKVAESPPDFDVILALLRLAPDNRAAALKRIAKIKGEIPDAARYALGADKPAFGKTAALDSTRRAALESSRQAALWVAAARARDPQADDALVEKRFPGLGPGSGTAARYEWSYRPGSLTHAGRTYHYVRFIVQVEPKMPKAVERDLPTVLMNRLPEHASSGGAAQLRWHASVWPAGREAHLVRGARLLGNNIDWAEAEWGNKTYLEPLPDPDEPLGPLARVALCLGLSAKEPGEHTLAADALAAAITDGRVDGNVLAPTLARMLTTGDIKPGRWAKMFGDVARISPLHTHIVRLMVENTLAEAGKAITDPPKDLHHVLELLLELLAETGAAVSSQAVRDALAQITASGKAGKAAKALLAAQAEPDAASTFEVVRAALQGRLERARRWSASSQ